MSITYSSRGRRKRLLKEVRHFAAVVRRFAAPKTPQAKHSLIRAERDLLKRRRALVRFALSDHAGKAG